MRAIVDFLSSLPIWVYAIAGGVLIILIVVLVVFIPRGRYKRRLIKVSSDPDLADELIRDKYDDATLLQRSGLTVRLATRLQNEALPTLIGIDDLWIQRLMQTKHAGTMKRILHFVPDKGLFACFITTLDKPRLAPIFSEWITKADDFLILRRVALSGKGEAFNGKAALEVLRDKIDNLREMTGDPEWASRYFAAKIILHDGSDRSTRAIWDAFDDPYPLVRKTVAAEFETTDSDKLYENLLNLLLNDPVFEVRKAARERIAVTLPAKHVVDVESLTIWQALHVLELLQQDDKQDENIALKFLASDNLELRFTAAVFLSAAGTLGRIFEENDFGDREDLERNYQLLKQACEVSITAFLGRVRRIDNPASLLIAARLLLEFGDREVVTQLADRVFGLSTEKKLSGDYFDTYQTLLECISRRGSDGALKLLERELYRHRDELEFLNLILAAIPERSEHVFFDRLLEFLLD
ncbi:MAG: hypothetical protein HN368_09025, partial [Spirochaetales bacterium]|nr:hypothetical protein [Spirochaetales bacterium]